MNLPTQEEIDAVMHFREGVCELRQSPFFIEEFRDLCISIREDEPKKNIHGHFPDKKVVSDMLIPFRRLWLQGEPCYFHRVANIHRKFGIPSKHIDLFVFSDRKSIIGSFPWFKEIALSPSDVINLWLNTFYFHTGKSIRHGQYSKKEFEQYKLAIGPVLFEFYFLEAVHEVGISFFNLDMCCRAFLEHFERVGRKPSFRLRVMDSDESLIERKTPGINLPGDTMSERLWRLRHRNKYEGLSRFFGLLTMGNEILSAVISRSDSFDALIDDLGVHLEKVNDIAVFDTIDITHGSSAIDAYHTAVRNRRSRKGMVVKNRTGKFFWSEDYVPILRDQYVELREALRKEPFE